MLFAVKLRPDDPVIQGVGYQNNRASNMRNLIVLRWYRWMVKICYKTELRENKSPRLTQAFRSCNAAPVSHKLYLSGLKRVFLPVVPSSLAAPPEKRCNLSALRYAAHAPAITKIYISTQW